MRRGALVLVMVAIVGCGGGGPSFVGTWVGSVSGSGANGPFTYGDTWAIRSGGGTGVVVSALNTCTEWSADTNGPLMTWSVTCGGYPYSGSASLNANALSVSASFGGANLTGDFARQ